MTTSTTQQWFRQVLAGKAFWLIPAMFLFSVQSFAQNVFNGEPVQWVGRPNGYSTTPYNSDYRTTSYRRVSTNSVFPTDGRGQWATTINVQNSGGNIAPDNMPGGGGSGWLLISGPSGNRFQNKWNFNGIGQAAINGINGVILQGGGQDMGLNMSTTGRYTFVFRDAGYANSEVYIGYTQNDPVQPSYQGQSFNQNTYGSVISISTNATPSSGENIYVRYRVGTNNFTTGTSVVQASGSGTSWSAEIPQQTCGQTVYFYVFTSTRTLSQINSSSEQDRSLAVLRYDDSFGNNFSYQVSPLPTAGITNNSGTTVLTCTQTSISVTATGGVAYSWDNGLGNNANATITAPGTYTVTVTGENGCTSNANINVTQDITSPSAGITNNTGTTVLDCNVSEINVTATGGVSYAWDNDLGSNANASISAAGTYTVTVTGANGCTSTANINVTQDVTPPTAGITNNSGTTILTCSQTSISVTATGGASYSWDNGLGNNANASITAPGNYTVTVTGANGCTSTASISVTQDLAVPGATTVSGFTNVCPYLGNNIQVTYTANAAGATSYNWVLPPNVNLVSGQGTANLTVTFNAGFATQANKQIRVTASNSCGSNTLVIYYLLVQFPSTPAPIQASSNNVCASLGNPLAPIVYTIPKVLGATSYIWTAQAGTTTITSINGAGENDTTVSVTFSNAFTTSAITVQAVNSCGTSGTRSLTITRANPSTPSLISGPTNACAFISPSVTAATYTVASQPNVTTYTWTLPVGAINVTGQGTNSVSFIYPAGYTGGTISVSASNGCGTSVQPRTLSIATLSPSAPSPIDVINTINCDGPGDREYIYSIASLPSNATSVQWTVPSGGTILSGQGSSSITVSYPSSAISGAVTATGVNNCGTSVTRVLNIKLPACPDPLAKSNGNEYAKGFSHASDKTVAPEAQVYPNPSTGAFNVRLQQADANQQVTVRLLDLQGRELKRMIMMKGAAVQFGNELKPGTYMLEFLQGCQRSVQKLIKL